MAAPQPFNLRLALGLVGILLASLMSGVGERVTQTVLTDVVGHFGFSHDEGSWLTTIYSAAILTNVTPAAVRSQKPKNNTATTSPASAAISA